MSLHLTEDELFEVTGFRLVERYSARRVAQILAERAQSSKILREDVLHARVYVIPAGQFVKIGVSADIEKRLNDLRAANPLIHRPAFLSGPLLNAYDVEAEAHLALDGYRVDGEWFYCDAQLAIDVINRLTIAP